MTEGNIRSADPPSEFSDGVQPEHDEVLKSIASQVNNLTLAEREEALFDIHGISPIEQETKEALDVSLKEMNDLLTQKIDYSYAKAFKLAESQDKEYARSRKLLLKFLRCEKYDAASAVSRLLSFFEHKLRLFGKERLCKEITQQDLNENDMKCLFNGHFQLLPTRDHIGRAQLVYLPRYATWETHDNALRVCFYVCCLAAADVETQKKGVVIVVHTLGNVRYNNKQNDPIMAWKSMKLFRTALPVNFVGHHICVEKGSFLHKFFSSITRFIGEDGIVRTRFHEGTSEEIDGDLTSFGINNVHFAMSQSGDKKVDKHKELLKSVGAIENQGNLDDNVVIVPSQTDVLLGRGKPIQNHPGNMRLSLIVETLLKHYEESSRRHEKTQLAEETVNKMKKAGVRFLSKTDGLWMVATKQAARERVSGTFRTVRERSKNESPGALIEEGKKRDWVGK